MIKIYEYILIVHKTIVQTLKVWTLLCFVLPWISSSDGKSLIWVTSSLRGLEFLTPFLPRITGICERNLTLILSITPHNICNLTPLMHRTRYNWSLVWQGSTYYNYIAFRNNQHHLARCRHHKKPPGRTTTLKPSSNSGLPIALNKGPLQTSVWANDMSHF